MKKLSMFVVLCSAVLVAGCAEFGQLRGTIERFPLGTVLDAAQAVYCAVSKCDAPTVPAPAPEVKP